MMQTQRCKYFVVIQLFLATVLWGADPGLNAFYEGKYDTSLAYYLKRLEDEPDNKVLHYNAGTSALKAGRSDLAATHFDKTMRYSEDPEFLAKTWYNRGHLKAKEGKLDEALKAFEQAILLNPRDINSKVMYELIKAQLQQQQDQQSNRQDQKEKEKQEKEKEQKSPDEENQQDSQKSEDKENQNQQEKKGKDQAEPEESQPRQQESRPEQKEEELTRQQMVNLLDAMREKEKEAMKEILRYRYQKSKIEREKDW